MVRQWLKHVFGGANNNSRQEQAQSGANAGSYAQAPLDRQASRSDIARFAQSPALSNMVTGYQFSATIQLRTPARILSRHNEMHQGESPPLIATEMWQGIWIPVAKSMRELGLDMDDFRGSTMASDVGPIPTDGGDYLKFLLRVRAIVEAETCISDRRAALKNEIRDERWSEYVRKLGGKQVVVSKFFRSFLDVLPGIPVGAKTALWESELVTPNKVASASDAALLAIRGIGPAKLKQIRERCAQADKKDNEFVDMVER